MKAGAWQASPACRGCHGRGLFMFNAPCMKGWVGNVCLAVFQAKHPLRARFHGCVQCASAMVDGRPNAPQARYPAARRFPGGARRLCCAAIRGLASGMMSSQSRPLPKNRRRTIYLIIIPLCAGVVRPVPELRHHLRRRTPIKLCYPVGEACKGIGSATFVTELLQKVCRSPRLDHCLPIRRR